jgi:hypothetical protein
LKTLYSIACGAGSQFRNFAVLITVVGERGCWVSLDLKSLILVLDWRRGKFLKNRELLSSNAAQPDQIGHLPVVSSGCSARNPQSAGEIISSGCFINEQATGTTALQF